jgi:PKD repeat protein
MDNKRKLLVLSLVCVMFFSVAPFLVTAAADEGSGNSTNDNNTVNNTVVPPTADFTADVTNGTAPLNVLFTSNYTGNQAEFNWTFGDGTFSNQNIASLRTYTQPGIYDVSLTVTNAAGSNTATKPGYIIVNTSNIPNVVPTTPCVNSSDNNSNTNQNDNCTNNCTNNTTLKSTCNVSKTVSTNLKVLCSGKAPRRVHFIDRSKNHVSTYWNFGDGKACKCKSIVHIYKNPGKYPVKFTVKYRSGKTKTVNAGYIVVTGSSPHPATNNTTNSSQPTPTPALTPALTPTPTPALTPTPTPTPTPGNNIIASWTGSANKNTEMFHVPSNEWKITWNTQAGNLGNGIFSIVIYNSDGSYKDIAANVMGSNSDSSIIRGSGDYYLKIVTTQQYEITVSQN